jgi:hypothetical protein
MGKSKSFKNRSGASQMSSVESNTQDKGISTAMFHSRNMPRDEHCISKLFFNSSVVLKLYIF